MPTTLLLPSTVHAQTPTQYSIQPNPSQSILTYLVLLQSLQSILDITSTYVLYPSKYQLNYSTHSRFSRLFMKSYEMVELQSILMAKYVTDSTLNWISTLPWLPDPSG